MFCINTCNLWSLPSPDPARPQCQLRKKHTGETFSQRDELSHRWARTRGPLLPRHVPWWNIHRDPHYATRLRIKGLGSATPSLLWGDVSADLAVFLATGPRRLLWQLYDTDCSPSMSVCSIHKSKETSGWVREPVVKRLLRKWQPVFPTINIPLCIMNIWQVHSTQMCWCIWMYVICLLYIEYRKKTHSRLNNIDIIFPSCYYD